MRLRVVHDEAGRIIAAAVVPAEDDSVAVVPLAGARQTEAEVEVPGDMLEQDLDLICSRMRVNTEDNRLVPWADER